jgi:predicted nucleic acid-binding protein
MAGDNGRHKRYILDTSAVIAQLAKEPGANKIAHIKPLSYLPFMALSELYYVIWNKHNKAEADRFYGIVKSWGIPILQPNERVILNAGRLKAVYKLGIADSYIAAFALDNNACLVTKDTDYRRLEVEIPIYWL